MPRSFRHNNRWSLALCALVLIAPLFVSGLKVEAQKRKPAQTVRASASTDSSQPQKKNLTRLNSSETAEGSSITIFSDMPLNDYSAYRGGDRFYVLIPGADASRVSSGLRGRGFTDVKTQQRGNDVLVSFRLLAGASARVSQKFNRLEILITVPALVAANAAANTNNSSSQNSTDPPRNSNTGSSSVGNTGRRGQRGSSGSQSNTGTSSTNETVSQPSDTVGQNPNTNSNPTIGRDGQEVQPGNEGLPPVTDVSPVPSPTETLPSDQVAQLQPTPGIPATTTEAPPVTSEAPAAGTSFGAQLKQNWLFILLAVAVAGLIAWVLFARSRVDQDVVERRVESIREARTQPVAVAAPVEVPVEVETAPVVEPEPQAVEAEPFEPIDVVAPAAVVAAADVEAPVEPVEEPVEPTEIEPLKPVAVELASSEVAGLLAGNPHDEVIIGTQNPEARQIIAAELLAALTGRNIIRNERARDAFIRYGYFDDATRTLRTADSPGERASAARSLGLARDNSATPHLVAALEDSSPEVRRAAVESLAEVRDPSAVASLEAMRDREKNRKVPISLIQRAIEASVVGRARVETPAPVEPVPAVTEAESISEVEEPAVEAPEITTFEPSPQLAVPEESVASIEVEEPETFEAVQAEVVEQPEMAELEAEPPASIPSEWVDVDVSQPLDSSAAEVMPSTELPVEEMVVEDEVEEAVIEEAPVTIEEPPMEVVAETSEPSSLPFEPAEAAVIASVVESSTPASERGLDVAGVSDKEIDVLGADHSGVPVAILRRLGSEEAAERAAAVEELASVGGDDSFREICASFDDPSAEVRNAAARALFSINPDRAASFTRALREASPERRRHIGSALSSSGLATEAIGHLMGESREKTYDAFSLLFLMSKAGEVQPLMRAVEEHPNNEVRLAVVKLLALSGQHEILPAFRRLAVRGSLPTEVRSAVMEAIYQISSQSAGGAS